MNSPPMWKKWLMPTLKLLVLILVAWFIRDTLVKAWEQIGRQNWQWQPWWLVWAGALYLLGLLPAGLYWHYILKVLGQDARWPNTLRAYYLGHLGKYVPGKAMVVILRAGLVRGRGVDTGAAAVSVFYETLSMMAVGAFLGAGALALRLREERMFFWGAIGLMIVAGLPIVPPIFRWLALQVKMGNYDLSESADLSRLGYGTLLAGFVCMLFTWILMAASLWAAFQAIGLQEMGLREFFAEYIAAVSLSMVAGFLSLIPAGLGVRDLVLVELLVRFFAISDAAAAVAGGLLRLIWLVSELIISGILYFVKRKEDIAPGTSAGAKH